MLLESSVMFLTVSKMYHEIDIYTMYIFTKQQGQIIEVHISYLMGLIKQE